MEKKISVKKLNINLQKELDKMKYFESIDQNQDMSGKMDYCMFCNFKDYNNNCTLSQQSRESNFVCAKSYRKMEIEKNEKK